MHEYLHYPPVTDSVRAREIDAKIKRLQQYETLLQKRIDEMHALKDRIKNQKQRLWQQKSGQTSMKLN